jgi:phage-related protein (TIGR01555 family)
MEMVAHMRLFASNEGITLIDAADDMVTTQATNFTGIADVLLQLGQQLSGNFQIPLVRLFGQSPAGLSATGESDLKTYYDGIRKRQVQDLLVMLTVIYRLIARSVKANVPEGFRIDFRPLWQMTETEKADVAQKDTQTVMSVYGEGLITDRGALSELQHQSRRTGRWKSITDESLAKASDELPAPEAEGIEAPPDS